MLLMMEKGIRGGLCHAIQWYAKANNKYMKYYDINKELSCLSCYIAWQNENWKSSKICSQLAW